MKPASVRLIFCLLAAALLGGCAVGKTLTSPGATGVVLDRISKQPLPDATAQVSRAWRREWPGYGAPTVEEAQADLRAPRVVTGPDGKFFLPPERRWFSEFPGPDEVRGCVLVQCAGHRAEVLPLAGGSDVEDLGPILLTPLRP